MPRKLLIWGGRLLLAAYFVAALIILVGRYAILPEIADRRETIERQLSQAIGLPVKIESLVAEWPGLHPRLEIRGLSILDKDGRPALGFNRVDAEIGWSSLWRFGLYLHRLEIVAPALDIRRTADGTLYVAGLPMRNEGESGFGDWLLGQGRIVVRDASLVWHDELRAAPPLELRHLGFELRNSGRHHSFGLIAEPSAATATRLDLRGNLVGDDLQDLAGWRGELKADLEQTDLTAWTPWIDAPLELTHGTGGLRLWFNFANLLPTGLTADLHLADASLRLRPDLPLLALEHLDGRLVARRNDEGYVGELRNFQLATRDGIVMPPTDARMQLRLGGRREGGDFSANGFDLATLAALADHLPLPAELHDGLQSLAPQGKFADLAVSWRGPVEAPAHWQLKGRFENLALAPWNAIPGFSGLSGTVEGDDSAGRLRLDSREATLALPRIFPEPLLNFATLNADAAWKRQGEQYDLQLTRFAFKNRDTTGEISGHYRYDGTGPGEIDLGAKLVQSAGNAVWRYIPWAVNQDTRDWLRLGILGGTAETATLRLKGPLAQFPFRDNKGGIFQVKANFHGATLHVGEGWPQLTDIDGDLLFEGQRMLIRGHQAKLMGVALSDVSAEIADLEVPEELLTVVGRAQGPTQRFLDYIEASPVGGRIDHFTQPMSAVGKGELDLRLTMPLRHLSTTQVQGRFRFADNQLRVLPVLPPFTAAQGDFGFTEDRLQAKSLRARFLGTPMALDVTSGPGGAVKVTAAGTLPAQALRQEYGLPVLDHLSGEAPWRGTVTVKKPGAEIHIESNLDGLSSSLPDPFNKSARDPLPLKVDGRIDPRGDEWTASLGGVATLRFVQSGETWRGRVGLGRDAVRAAAPLPTRGTTLAIAQPKLDIDTWRDLLQGAGNGTVPAKAAASPGSMPQIDTLDLKSPDVRLLGRSFHEMQLTGTRGDTRWRFGIDSREVQGQISWDGTGAGRIAGRLSRLYLPAADKPGAINEAADADNTQELPAIDLMVDNFRLREMSLGEVRVAAENRGGTWQAKIDMKNDAARLTGEGRWRPSRTSPESVLGFKLDVSDAEKLLGHLGMPDAVRRGSAKLEGRLAWAGAPTSMDFDTLSGQIKLDAEKGQFKKLEPGVGRLLGVLSLQSLPRRITLDFRDIFSEGFAFDSITGIANVDRGQMRTDGLSIRGPAAKIHITGAVNLSAETQDLNVRVQPALGESIAVGTMMVHPVAGAAAWVAQKLLNDPLDQAFAYEYGVTGNWDDPKVEKLHRKLPEPTVTSPATPNPP
jgi:uncharacterized protein (TIGR02099 family)